MNQKLLDNFKILEEAIWLIALHIEKFMCKNNTLPCINCRNSAIKLAPVFLVGIEGIAEKVFLDAGRLAHLALDKIGMQRWEVKDPWKSPTSLTPVQIPSVDSDHRSMLERTFSGLFKKKEKPTEEKVTYKLVTRVPPKEEA